MLHKCWSSIISNSGSMLTISYFQYCVCADHRLFPILCLCWPSIISNTGSMLTIDYFEFCVHAEHRWFGLLNADHRLFRLLGFLLETSIKCSYLITCLSICCVGLYVEHFNKEIARFSSAHTCQFGQRICIWVRKAMTFKILCWNNREATVVL